MSFKSPFGQFMLNGGSPEMAVDGSITPVVFELPGDADKRVVIKSIVFNLATSSAPRVDGFGDNASILPNGLLYEADLENNELYSAPLRDNDSIFGLAGELSQITMQGGQQYTKAAIVFGPAEPILNFGRGGYYRITIQDNLPDYCTHLSAFVSGYYVNTPGQY